MKKIVLVLSFMIAYTVIFCQDIPFLDSMMKVMTLENRDSAYVNKLQNISDYYKNFNHDTARLFAFQALSLSNELGYNKGKLQALEAIGLMYRGTGDIPAGLDYFFQGLQVAENNHFDVDGAFLLINIGHIYRDMEDYVNAINYYKRANEIMEVKHDVRVSAFLLWNIGNIYRKIKHADSALFYKRIAFDKFKIIKLETGYEYMMMGDIEFELGNHALAFDYLQKSIATSRKLEIRIHEIFGYIVLAEFFRDLKQPDSCINYANKALALAKKMSIPIKILEASRILSTQYELRDSKEALYYRKIADSVRESLFGASKVQSLQKIVTNEQERHRSIETENIAYQNKMKQYALMGCLLVSFVIAFLLFRNNRNKQKANMLMAATLANLKAAQSQLIQSEKMASLGELTSGIAHEIQNPLNFVNNFSEVNTELIDEANQEIDKGNVSEVKSILNDIKENEQKINLHGKRADAIVKGMLQHSQNSSGVKVPTDINALADEYLTLAYHGHKAKDKSFNATLKTEFDPSAGQTNIIPQDIGRVLLNLYYNAFYAVAEKQKLSAKGYEPCVTLRTKKINGELEISVADNGNGIPVKVLDKVFQPFFTTKPTGQGTGLGLSLSYDIIKAHQGKINIRNTPGEGAEFIIILPIGI